MPDVLLALVESHRENLFTDETANSIFEFLGTVWPSTLRFLLTIEKAKYPSEVKQVNVLVQKNPQRKRRQRKRGSDRGDEQDWAGPGVKITSWNGKPTFAESLKASTAKEPPLS
jgi:hypothetical protein